MTKNKIIVGVTQFGLNYGIMNNKNYNKKKKLKQVLNFSKQNNIKALYTSKYYGNSNNFLGGEDLEKFKIFTKFKPEDILHHNYISEINNIKKVFKKKTLIIIVDRFEKLSKKKALKVFNVLVNLKKKKQISKFGFAIYSFKNLKKICKDFKPDILQCPYNVFDRRLDEKELLQYLSSNKIEIHVRSIFLQGLLLADYSKLPKKFLKWKSVFKKFYDWVSHNKISNLSACYNFIKNNKYIDKILIGVDHYTQLKEIISVRRNRNIKFPDIFVKNEKLINPSKW